MAKQNSNTPEDLEMGSTESPKINSYAKGQTPKAKTTTPKPEVDPTDTAPEAPKLRPPVKGTQTIGQAKKGETKAAQPAPKKSTPPNPEARKKAIIGCLGAFGIVAVIFLIISFIFIGQTDANTINPIARLLGLNQALFINGLITLIHILFILISLTIFVFTMIGLFRATMAKKEEKQQRKDGLKMGIISGSILMVILIAWGFVYIYLDAKRVALSPEVKEPIVTVPEDTLQLTGPIEIKFDASNVPIDKRKYQIISYEWDFDDDQTATSQIVAHTFEERGRYNVLLQVTKRDKKTGEESIDEYGVIVSISNQALSAIFSADPQSGEAPLEVTFDASKSQDPDGRIESYEWDLDEDGQFDDADGVEVTHTFEKTGKYTVGLRVTSSLGEFSISEKEIIVEKAVAPDAVISIVDEPEKFVTAVQYLFKADESTSPNGDIESYEWDFGDGDTFDSKSVSYTFTKSGTYEVKLTVTDEEGKEGESTKLITVGAPQGTPKAKITTDPKMPDSALALEGKVPFTVKFDATGSTDSDNNIVDYEWDFDGDSKPDAFGAKASYTFKEEGTYSVTLLVTDSDKNVGRATQGVKVAGQGIQAAIEANKIDGTVPLTVSFDASGSSFPKGKITSYSWDFGDGSATKLGSSQISHKYTEIGTFTATVRVIGNDNSTDTAEILITVREIALQACFTSVFEEGDAPLTTTFNPSCTTGSAANYFWDFGDGATSTSVKPTHTFDKPGTYKVTLEVSDNDNTVDETELTIKVN